MELNEIKALKRATEKKVRELVNNFETLSGVSVVSLRVESITRQVFDERGARHIVDNIEMECTI